MTKSVRPGWLGYRVKCLSFSAWQLVDIASALMFLALRTLRDVEVFLQVSRSEVLERQSKQTFTDVRGSANMSVLT